MDFSKSPLDERQPWPMRGTLLVFGLMLIAWISCLQAGFVIDDSNLILANTSIESFTSAPSWFRSSILAGTPGYEPPGPYFRPLFIASIAWDRWLFGTAAWGYHLHSLLWHLAATALVGALTRRIMGSLPALFAMALFGLHPVQSEVVFWISARNDAMATVFLLASLLLLLPEKPSASRLLVGGLCALMSLLSKESVLLLLPLALPILDLARFGRPKGAARYGALALAIATWYSLYASADVKAPLAEGAWNIEALLAMLTAWTKVLFVPWSLTFDHHIAYAAPSAWEVVLTLLGSSLGIGLSIWFGKRWAAIGWVLFLLALLPAVAGVVMSRVASERYLYLPMVWLSLAIGIGVARLPRQLTVIALYGAACTLAIHQRAKDWRSDEDLFEAALRVNATPYGHLMLGRGVQGESPEKALPHFIAALENKRPLCEATEDLLRTAVLRADAEAAGRIMSLISASGCALPPPSWGAAGLLSARTGNYQGLRAAALRLSPTDDFFLPVTALMAAIDRGPDGYLEVEKTANQRQQLRRAVIRTLESGGAQSLAQALGALPP